MFPLHKRRIRGDLTELFNILHQFDKINPDKLFEINYVTVTRGNGKNLKRHFFFFFTSRPIAPVGSLGA